MKADFYYENPVGRALLNVFQHLGLFKVAAWWLHTPFSRSMIDSFIRDNHIDMSDFKGQTFKNYADFFARKKEIQLSETTADQFISPCDGLLSCFPITDKLELHMKGSVYGIEDLIPDTVTASQFADGLAMVFRLEATDYHHFCFIDTCTMEETHYIPGLLHSVQPVALRSVPVFRLNRRWWTLLHTENWGTVAHCEIGAMVVGGVSHVPFEGTHEKGTEMGNFTLQGSTIVILLNKDAREHLTLNETYVPCVWTAEREEVEIPVKIGTVIGSK